MNDHILWRDLDSLLHERAVLVGGPQLSWCMGGPKVLGGPNLVGGASDPCPYHAEGKNRDTHTDTHTHTQTYTHTHTLKQLVS